MSRQLRVMLCRNVGWSVVQVQQAQVGTDSGVGCDDVVGVARMNLDVPRCSRLAALFFLRRGGARPQPQEWQEWYGSGRQIQSI